MGANKITGLGTPTANTTDAANTAYVDAAISTAVTNVIASAPALLDTLDELAAALGDDANFATTVTTNLAAKANIASPTFTGIPAAPTAAVSTNTTQIATTAYVMAATVAPSNLTGPITSVGSATSIASQTGTGTKFVVDTSPTLVTPVLGVATATSINGTTIPSSATLVKTSDTLATLSATTSAQLAGVISDETGSGSLVFGTGPTMTLPVINNIKLGYTTTATAAGTTTLTVDSNAQQFFTGTTTQTVVLPVASTMTLGQGFYVENTSTGNLTINSSGANLVVTLIPGATVLITCILTSGTSAASWDVDYHGFSAITGTGSVVLGTSPTIATPVIDIINAAGTSTSASLWSGIAGGGIGIGSGITTGTVAIANGNAFAGTLNLGSSTSGTGSKTINVGTGSTTGTTTVNIGSSTGATSVVNINGTLTAPVISSPKISSTYSAKTAAYTFASGDEGQLFSMNNAATQQFNIPTDATFNFAVGTEINVFWITGAGQPTIGAVTPGTTTVISTGATSATPKLRVVNSGATCKKLAANSWIVFGDLA
jgi:hypothetical protein